MAIDIVARSLAVSVKQIAVVANSAITAGTHTKITYDSKGLVTGGTNLAASDIPNLPASKITSGTFADARIASASTWNNKQNALTTEQLAAANSGITAGKVSTYDGYQSQINGKYTKPSTGIPKTDLASAVQTSLGKADSAVQKPSTPTTESAITINSSGTISTKPLSSITGKTEVYVGSTTPTNPGEILWIDPNGTSGGGGGGGKLYRHHIRGNLVTSDGQDARASIGVDIIKTSATPMNEAEFKTYVSTETVASISGMEAHGTVAIYSVPDINEYGVYGAVFNPRNTEAAKCIFTSFTFNRFTDTVTEL